MASSAASKRPASGVCGINDLPDDLLCPHVDSLLTKLGAHSVCRKWNYVLKRHKCDELWGTVPILRAVCRNLPSQKQSQVALYTAWLAQRAASVGYITIITGPWSFPPTAGEELGAAITEGRLLAESRLPFLLASMAMRGSNATIHLSTGLFNAIVLA